MGAGVDHRWVARVGLSWLCGIQGIATLALDLNRTHATNPEWTRHARFHVVWQTLNAALLAIVELGLLWSGLLDQMLGFYLALLMTSLSPIAFLATWAARRQFGGASSDPNGFQPLRVALAGRVIEVDRNMAAVLTALLTMVVIVSMYKY
jgi:hypothetical protein